MAYPFTPKFKRLIIKHFLMTLRADKSRLLLERLLLPLVIFSFCGCAYEDGVITNGEIYEIKRIHKGNAFYAIYYQYEVSGKIYNGSTSYDDFGSRNLQERLLKTKVPVVYRESNPKVSSLLLTEYDFRSEGLILPDSLKWIEEYLK